MPDKRSYPLDQQPLLALNGFSSHIPEGRSAGQAVRDEQPGLSDYVSFFLDQQANYCQLL